MRRKRDAENGFTLIELMVVVLVLAILIAVAVPAFVGARTRGQNGAAKANLKTSLNAAAAYAAASAGSYPDDTQLTADEKSLTFVSGSTVSTGPSSISIASVGGSFTAAVRAASGTCFRVSTVAGGSPVWTSPTGNCQGTSGGVVTTLAGSGSSVVANGTGTSASFKDPLGIAVDSDGNVFVADAAAYLIRKITPAGVVTTFAGSGANASADGTGTAASFAKPYGIAIDAANNLYVAENSANKIRKITPAGVVTTYAGSGGVGTTDSSSPLSATFNKPEAVAVDAAGNLYVADTNNNRIRKITPAGVVSTLAGLTIGNLDGTGTGARFNKPGGIAVDSAGDIYVADTSNHTIRKITPAGVVTTVAGNGSAGFVDGTGTAARFNYPTSIVIDKADNIRISDMVNSALRTMTPAGIVTTWAGGSAGYVDETGTSAQFNWQWHIAVDSTGVVYVADDSNYRVRKVEP